MIDLADCPQSGLEIHKMVHILPDERKKVATVTQHRVGSANEWSKETSVMCFLAVWHFGKYCVSANVTEETYKTDT